jgi:hypothetical protein
VSGDEQMRVLVTVKAYPQPSQRYGETVCVAGVRIDTGTPSWVRLYPVGFRDLPRTDQFKKYQVVDLKAAATTKDQRPESRRPNLHSMTLGDVIEPNGRWRHRWTHLAPLAGATTTCELLAKQGPVTAPSLGLVKPRVDDLTVEKNEEFAADKKALAEMAAAPDLFGSPERSPLEAAPFKLKYRYRCESEKCPGHHQSIIDWEAGESARKWQEGYSENALADAMRTKWLDQMCAADRDTYFYLGNQAAHRRSFLVLGVFWPPARSRPDEALF